MKKDIKEGQRYIRRNGSITSKLIFNKCELTKNEFPFICRCFFTYRSNGSHSLDERDISPLDLVKRYKGK